MTKEFSLVPPETPRTFIHEALEDFNLHLNKNVSFIDLHKQQSQVPPFGFYIGENKYIVGSGKHNPEAQYLMTDKIVHCTGIAIIDGQEEYSLLAHVYSTRSVREMFREFRQAMFSPEEIDITLIPGFRQTEAAIKRLHEIVEVSLEHKPRNMSIDIAKGDPDVFRGIVLSTLSGQIAELSDTIQPDQARALNTLWGKPIR